jgi:predicted RNase H-like nuclease (RuvC/YqgF family)
VVDLKHIELATDADKAYGIDKWAALFRSISWEEILMTAKNDEYLMEATKTLYNLNADDMVRQRCQARMDAELQEQYLLKKIDTLTTDNDKLTADNAAKDAEIEALKKELASLQQNV